MAVPPGRGRWRFLLCDRYGTPVAELADAVSRKVVFDVDLPAQATFSISGRSPQAAASRIGELYTDLKCYRWNDATGTDTLLFRGRIGQTQDAVSADRHTVNVTALDYRAMLHRRVIPYWLYWVQVEQLQIAEDLVYHGNTLNFYWTPPPFGTNGNLGVFPAGRFNPDGTPLAGTTMLRDRTYQGGETVAEMIDNLSNCQGGFDWEVGADLGARFWYPQRGAVVANWVAEYGSTIQSLSRTINSSGYANWVRVTGKALDPALPPMASTAYQTGLSDPTVTPWGIWQAPGSYPDIADQTTLDQQAAGLLATTALLEPSYVMNVTPGRWNPSDCWLGDQVTVVVNSGRLAVNNVFRLKTVAFDISDDGAEAAQLTMGVAEPRWTAQGIEQSLRIDRLERR